MTAQVLQVRSLYRQFLRELPARSPSILANPSPLQQHIRADFLSGTSEGISPNSENRLSSTLEEAEQYLHYLRAQRKYITLIERYNPGMNMSEEDRVRLTARRVGMDLPVEMEKGGKE
ncbi:hypothetical protein BAUCODRAFT_66265 [Baudoinia panamericana UAMH 10762]|uniref:ATP synthase assembly factor FMC1, mitochondrial n=1 Tax=Baudoinia panamericana (strain UAMH 10762) TaxID=717646 RepID=M2MMV2_BAUPA|nr:uncharacterized protein BAUCODRAFT_66265 [Baudoinia panamericana UAMH 10762]EMC97996.1 hypothetical protein BAUCODRAFT_66265 [Baudoinia panamericana UAMH 10762]